MLYTKFKGYQPAGFREDFWMVFTMGMAVTSVIWPGLFEQTFILTTHKSLKFGFNGPSSFAAEDVWV